MSQREELLPNKPVDLEENPKILLLHEEKG